MIKVLRLDHIVLKVQDQEKSLRFYGDILGLGLIRVQEWRNGNAPFPSIRIGEGALIDLVQRPEGILESHDDNPRNLDHFCMEIEVRQWADVISYLVALGIAPENVPSERFGAQGIGMSIYIKDPDGNRIELKSYM